MPSAVSMASLIFECLTVGQYLMAVALLTDSVADSLGLARNSCRALLPQCEQHGLLLIEVGRC